MIAADQRAPERLDRPAGPLAARPGGEARIFRAQRRFLVCRHGSHSISNRHPPFGLLARSGCVKRRGCRFARRSRGRRTEKNRPSGGTGGRVLAVWVLRGSFYLNATGIGAGCLPSAQRTLSMTSCEVMSSISKLPAVLALL